MKSSSPPQKIRWGLAMGVVLGLALTIGLTVYLAKRGRAPQVSEIPTIATNGLDAPVILLWEELTAEVRRSPRHDMAWGSLGLMLRAHEFDREASVCLAIAQKLNPQEPRWPYHLAHTQLPFNEAQALASMRRAMDLCADDRDSPRLWLGRRLVERARWDEASALVSAWLDKQPDHAAARLLAAQIAFGQQRWKDSARSLSVCVSNQFTIRQAYALLGQVYLRLGMEDQAAQANRVVQSLPDDPPWPDPFERELMPFRVSRRHLIENVPLLLAAGDLAEAEHLTRQLLKDYPDAAEGWLFQGRLQYLARDWSGAEESLQRHLASEPDSVDGLMQLGQLRLQQNQTEEAARIFARVVELKPDSQVAHYQRAEALWRSGKTEEAVPSFRRAIQCDPSFLEAYLRLAGLLRQTGEEDEALRLLQQAMLVDPFDMRVQEAVEQLQSPPP